MRKNILLAAAAALLISAPAFAAPYGMAGCGLGSLVFGNKAGFVQIFAATTNGTFNSQTFGITSGTSNCVDTSGAASGKLFIDVNREALAKDMSRGSGETIKSLSAIAGCKDSEAVGAHLQKSFKSLSPSLQSEAFAENVLKTLRTEKTLSCGRIGV
jgi:hypothetical protein